MFTEFCCQNDTDRFILLREKSILLKNTHAVNSTYQTLKLKNQKHKQKVQIRKKLLQTETNLEMRSTRHILTALANVFSTYV